MRTVLGLTASALLALAAGAPTAHAGCVDDYLAGGGYYVAPRQDTVTVSGGVVTVDTNAVAGDVNEVAGFGVGVALNEAGLVLVLVDCVK